LYWASLTSLRSRRGITLVELMVVVALAGVIFFGLAITYMMIMDWWDRSNSLMNLQRDGSYALYEIATAIRMGSMVQIPSETQLTIQDASASTMEQFYLESSDNSLRDSSGEKVIPSLVDSLQFAFTGKTISVTLILTDSESQEAYFNTSASLRN
jgi:prepilin-type N-terminal cleavage/methylation domain-containing protein